MATEIVMPKLGLTMKEGTVDKWLVKEGDYVNEGDPLVDISSEKLTNEVEAPISGTVLKLVVKEGDVIPSQAVMAYIGEEGETIDSAEETEEIEAKVEQTKEKSAKKEKPSKEQTKEGKSGDRVFITPVARKMAEEKGIDINDLNGTGGNGRITRLDVERYVPSEKEAKEEQVVSVGASDQEYGKGLEGMRKTIASRMMRSVQTTAQVTNQRKVDITKLMKFREEIKEKVDQPFNHGELSINTLLAKAVIMALKDKPEMNAWYYDDQHIKVDEIHIGIATAIDDGLVVPVVKDAHQMSLSQLGPAIRKVTSEAKSGSLDGSLYSGSTFSITNLGSLEIEYFTPIINTPEVAILGVGALQKELELEDGKVSETLKLPLSLTYDHQIIDGAPAAEFLIKLAEYLQNPYKLII